MSGFNSPRLWRGSLKMTKIIYLILAFTALFIWLKYFEGRSVYFPVSVIDTTPGNLGLPFEDIKFRAKDGVALTGWFIPADSSYGVLLFCHGNGGNISHRLEKIKLFHNLGLDVFIFDYRDYGGSAGSPSEKGLYLDTQAAYAYLRQVKNIGPEKIVVFGESLGSATAIELASKNNLAGLIIEGGFSSAKDMAKWLYPLMPAFLYTVKFDSLSKIGKVKFPKLFFHSRSDEIVPFVLAKKLFDAAGLAEFVEINGAHNTAFMESEAKAVPRIENFLKRTIK